MGPRQRRCRAGYHASRSGVRRRRQPSAEISGSPLDQLDLHGQHLAESAVLFGRGSEFMTEVREGGTEFPQLVFPGWPLIPWGPHRGNLNARRKVWLNVNQAPSSEFQLLSYVRLNATAGDADVQAVPQTASDTPGPNAMPTASINAGIGMGLFRTTESAGRPRAARSCGK